MIQTEPTLPDQALRPRRRAPMKFSVFRKLFAGLLLLAVLISGSISIVSFVLRTRFVRAAIHTRGRVVELRERSSDNGSSFSPVFTYRDSRGEEHRIYSTVGSDPPNYEVGQSVPVLYRPNRPLDARIDDFHSVWGLPFVTGIVAVVDLAIALIIWFWPSIVRIFHRESTSPQPA